jgi:hypothetical protein
LEKLDRIPINNSATYGGAKSKSDRKNRRVSMVDIAMCARRDCGRKHTCYRYLAFPDEYQTYLLIDTPIIEDCEYYWRCRNPYELRTMNKLNNSDEED